MTLDAHMWGNPETVLQRKQEAEARKHANCGSCVHHQSMQVSSGVIHICDLKRQKYGYRCINFKIKKVKL